MKRRSFIQMTALTAATPLVTFTGCTSAPKSAVSIADAAQDFELSEATISGLTDAMASGHYTSRQICEKYLERIASIDQIEGGLNAVIELNPDALSIADKLDQERADGQLRGALHGIPIMIKDNIDTGDQMMTTAGALALVGSRAPRDAHIVEMLRKAGCVLLGKTNLSEWANFRSNRSSSGWSGRGRQTRNPFALDRNPCGSSAGSGAAVSANLCAITIGTETDGSIICPSSTNGVVGIKPTVGLWGRSGIIPISATQDTAGPMARTVADAATLLGALSGVDPRDDRTKESIGKSYSDYTQFLNVDGLKGKRIGVLRGRFGRHEDIDREMEKALEAIRHLGAELVDPIKLKSSREIGNSEYQVLLYEFKEGVNRYLANLGDSAPVKTLQDVIDFNLAHADESMPYFGQEILLEAQEKGGLDEAEYRNALSSMKKAAREDGIDATLREHNLDAIVAPSGGPAWTTDLITGDHGLGGSSGPAARAGYPNITVPAGYVHGLPVGLSFFSTAYREPELIAMAYAFEQATGARRAPTLPATLQLP